MFNQIKVKLDFDEDDVLELCLLNMYKMFFDSQTY